MKGQYLNIEWIFFFGLGVAMITAVFFMFTMISNTYAQGSTTIQLESVGRGLQGAIVNVFEESEQTNASITYNLKIPTSVSGCVYAIAFDDGLELYCSSNPQRNIKLNLYNINTRIPDILYSTKGVIKISAENGEVMLS